MTLDLIKRTYLTDLVAAYRPAEESAAAKAAATDGRTEMECHLAGIVEG